MDVFETDTDESFTVEQLARIKALECASRIVEGEGANQYRGTRDRAEATMMAATKFYYFIMNG